MIDALELKGAIAKRDMSQSQVADSLGIAPKTFYEKMKKGVFTSTEISAMIRLLAIEDPMRVFFPEFVT